MNGSSGGWLRRMLSRAIGLIAPAEGGDGGEPVDMVLARGSLGTLLVRFASAGLALALQLALARLLGANEYGVYVLAFAWLAVLTMVCRLGMDTGLTRFVAEYRARAAWGELRGVVKWASRNTAWTSLVVATLAGLATWLLRDEMQPGQAKTFWIAFLILPLLSLTLLQQGALRGFRRVVRAELAHSVLRPVLMLAALAGAALAGLSLTAPIAMGMTVATYGVALILAGWWLTRAIAAEARPAPETLHTGIWWRVSLPLVFLQGMAVLQGRLDILMLGSMADSQSVGVYGAVTSIAGVMIFGLAVVNPIAAPLISELFHSNRRDELQRAVTLAARLSTLVSVAVGLFLLVAGKWLLSLFGAEFVAGHNALLILLAGQAVNALSGSVGFVMTMTGHQGAAAAVLTVVSAVNVVLNLLLIPRFGLEGAAMATAISIAAWNIAMFIYVRRKLGIRSSIF